MKNVSQRLMDPIIILIFNAEGGGGGEERNEVNKLEGLDELG